MKSQPLSALLTAEVVAVAPTDLLSDVLRDMQLRHISCIVVADAGRRPLGIFTERDAVAILAADLDTDAMTVGQVMSRPVFSLPAATDYREAYQRMSDQGLRHLVALADDGALVGVASEADFLQHMGEEYLVELKTVAAAMDRSILAMDEAETLAVAAKAMHQRGLDHVAVTRAGKPVGLLTERDVVRLARDRRNRECRLGSLMTVGVHAISPEAPVQEAVRRMREAGVRRLLVMTSRGLEGVITRHDVVKALQGGYVEYLRDTIARLRHQLPAMGKWPGFQRQTLLGGVLDRIGDGIYLVDGPTGRILDVNEQGCAMLGYRREEMQALDIWQLSEAIPDQAGWAAWKRRMVDGLAVFETRHRARDGSWMPVEIRAYGVEEGGESLFIGIARDLTVVKAAQEALHEGELLYRHVIDSAVDGFFVLGPDRRFAEVNDALCRLYGYSREELLGCSPLDFVTDESRSELIAQMSRIETTDRRRYQLTGRRRDGSTVPLLLNNSTHRNARGEVIGSFGFITDLTPIMEAQRAVADSERELHRILDHMQDTYYRTDAEGRLLRVSKSVKQLLGWEPEELLGRSLADYYARPSERGRFLEALRAAGGRVSGYESEMRHRDGRSVWVQTNSQYVRDAAGRILGVEGNSRDTTEQRRAEEGLRLAAQVFENSGEGIMITDADNRIVSVNQAFSDTTGYAAADVVGRTPAVLASGRHDESFYQEMWSTLDATGYWQGEIWNRRKDGEVYPEWLGISTVRDPEGRVSHRVAIFSDISERKAAEARIEFLAHHDPLTKLPNRLLLKDRLEQAIAHGERTGARVALLFIDLDRFKTVNDSLGHPVGDALLQDAARRLRRCVRDTDTVSRQGGDEFLVVLTDLGEAEAATRVAEQMLTAMSEPFQVEGHEVGISCSVGVAVFPDDGREFDALLRKADIAMYHAKEAGRNTFRYYTARMNIDALERLDLQNRMRRGLDRKEFVLHYQPLIELETDRIVGAEALIRWNSPELGQILPGRFIPVAEDSGLIVPIGEWVLTEACRELQRWHEAGHRHLSVAVNISAIQFRRGNVEESVTRALAQSGADPASLELELTESVLLHGAEQVLAAVQRLKNLGVRLSIDDFGTGYSSLAYLKRFAVDKLKIDQSFVRDLPTDADDAAIVRAIIQMATSLNLTVLAEGVESAAIAEGLRQFRCSHVQGYHFGRPMPAEEFRALIDAHCR